MGSHFAYTDKFTEPFQVFNYQNNDYCSSVSHLMGKKDFITLDEYDNSILYNGYVVSSLIDSLKCSSKKSSLIYVSDHGEEVYNTRLFAGRAFDNDISPAMCNVPLILWEGTYLQDKTDYIYNPNLAISTADIIHSILHWAQVQYKLYDDTRSMFYTP